MNKPDETHCPFCHRVASAYWRAANVWKCSVCGLLFRSPLPLEEDLVQRYEESWSDPEENRNETGGTDLDQARIYATKLADSLGLKGFRGLKLLEYGAGRGTMLTALSDLGAEVYGVEPFGYDYLERQRFRVFRTLDQIPKGLFFDGIITIDVIEHLPAPWNELARLRESLGDAGWIYISTLNSNGANAQLNRSRWREVVKPVHLTFFTPRNLEVILAKCGYSRYTRLQWIVRYTQNPIRTSIHYALQYFSVDGELRYLAWK